MGEDNVKRNKRISEWQKDKRIVILAHNKVEIQQHATNKGFDSLNAYINKLIADDMGKEEGK